MTKITSLALFGILLSLVCLPDSMYAQSKIRLNKSDSALVTQGSNSEIEKAFMDFSQKIIDYAHQSFLEEIVCGDVEYIQSNFDISRKIFAEQKLPIGYENREKRWMWRKSKKEIGILKVESLLDILMDAFSQTHREHYVKFKESKVFEELTDKPFELLSWVIEESQKTD